MSISILTPYKVFFITQSDILFALMKDGRVLKIKQTPYFSNISSDRKILCGISFDGENTHILSMPFGFDLAANKEVTSLFGYFYYPCLSKNAKKIAIIEADLLKPRPQGELRIYKRKIKRWYLENSFEAKMKPPFLLPKDDSLLFIDKDNQLMHYLKDLSVIAADVTHFCVSPTQTKVAYFNGSHIGVYSLLQHQQIATFPAKDITALCFDLSENEILYAIAQENRFAIYATNFNTQKTVLLTQTDGTVNFLSS